MTPFEYFWDNQANCLLVWVDGPETVDVVSVDWLDGSQYTTIAVGTPMPAQDGSDFLVVALPEVAGQSPVTLTVTGVGQQGQSHAAPPMTERIILDANARLENADRKLWIVEEGSDGPTIAILGADEKVPTGTISSVYASPRHGQTICPAESTSGEGKGGCLRLRVFKLDDDDPGAMEIEVEAESDMPLPETKVRFATLSCLDHVLPSLDGGGLDPATLCNVSEIILGDRRATLRKHVFAVPASEGGEARHLSYLDRAVIITSPPAKIVFERSATNSVEAGRNGVALLVNGKDDYVHVDDGKLLDDVIAAQPAQTVAENRDIVRAYSDVGKPMQLTDMDHATEITAAVYSEMSHLVSARHGARAAQLTPVNIDQFLSAPSYFGLLAALDKSVLPANAPRKLATSLAANDEREVMGVFAAAALKRDLAGCERLALWLETAKESNGAFIASLLPFYPAARDLLEAGISPVGVDIGQLGEIADQLQLSAIRQSLDVLTCVRALPMSMEHQFVDADSDDLDTRADHLDAIINDVVDLCRDAVQSSGLSDGVPFEKRDLLEVGHVRPPTSNMTGPVGDHRAFHFLLQSLTKQFSHRTIRGANEAVQGVLAQISAWLYTRYQADFAKIQDIVRTANVADPIELENDNVVTLMSQFSEGEQERFAGPVGHEVLSWLSSTSDNPDLIAMWKRNLLAQLEQKNRMP